MARARQGGRRMFKTWFASGNVDAVIVTGSQGELTSITNTEAERERTLLRQRGEILITATPDAATDSDVIGLGLVMIPETTRAVGGLSLPGPIVDAGADFWLWHRFVPLDSFGATSEATADDTCWAKVEIDGKAMRRWPTDVALVLVAELTSGDFSAVTANGRFRVLTGA